MTNQAVVRGRNLSSGWPLEARLAYVDATLTDLTPATPLRPWALGDSRVAVRAAKVRVDEAGLSRVLGELAAGKLSNPRVYLKPGNRVGVTGTARWHGLPVPVAMDYRLERVDGHTVRLTPCGMTGGAARLAGLDFRKLLASTGPARVAADGTITLDLARVVQADLTGLETGPGSLTATMGRPPGPAERPGNWLEVDRQGDLDAGAGLLHDAHVLCRDDSPATPLPLNAWQAEGHATLLRGEAAIDPAELARQIEAAEPLFKVGKLTLEGTTYRVEGTYNAFVKLPTRFDLTFTRTADGRLRLAPGGAKVMGLPAGQIAIPLGFLKPDGDGYLVDLKAAAGLDMPKIGQLKARNGCLMLTQP